MKGHVVMCLRQIERPDGDMMTPGVGDCTTCVPAAENKECRMYCPVTLYFEDIKGEE